MSTYGTLNADLIGNSNGQTGNAIGPGFKNRIINGDMRIAQRGTAAVTVNDNDGLFPVDRFYGIGQASDGVFTCQQSTTSPTGFVNSIIATVTTADASIGSTQRYVISQYIEGTNVSDLSWGSANAKTVTLSFWVRSSLTGTFGGSVINADNTRSYPFSYTISAADTWEQKSVTIAGDTSGTWLTTNGIGLKVNWSLGAGSSYKGTAGSWAGSLYWSATGATDVIGTLNATWYITGVQLEVGSSATSFDYRPYGTELQLCQRYAVQLVDGVNQVIATGQCFSTSAGGGVVRFPVEMRAAPTITASSAAHFSLTNSTGSTAAMGGTNFVFASTKSFLCEFTGRSGSGLTAGNATIVYATDSAARLLASAEL